MWKIAEDGFWILVQRRYLRSSYNVDSLDLRPRPAARYHELRSTPVAGRIALVWILNMQTGFVKRNGWGSGTKSGSVVFRILYPRLLNRDFGFYKPLIV